MLGHKTPGALALASGVNKSGGLFHLLLCHGAVVLCHKACVSGAEPVFCA